MELVGLLHIVNDEKKVSEKYKTREFILNTDFDSPYPQFISLQLANDKCSQVDNLSIGDMVKVQINIKGRKWDGPQGEKYFNTIEAWRVEVVPKAS